MRSCSLPSQDEGGRDSHYFAQLGASSVPGDGAAGPSRTETSRLPAGCTSMSQSSKPCTSLLAAIPSECSIRMVNSSKLQCGQKQLLQSFTWQANEPMATQTGSMFFHLFPQVCHEYRAKAGQVHCRGSAARTWAKAAAGWPWQPLQPWHRHWPAQSHQHPL